MTKLAALLLVAASGVASSVALHPGVASAQNMVATDGYERARTPREVDARLGMLLGGADVGDADGFSIGISGALGYRIGDITLRGLVDYYKVGDNSDELMERKGRATRLGGALRYSFANTGFESRFAVDFWGELGAGYEHVAWRHGGVLDRPSGELGFGLDIAHRGSANARGERKKVGYFMALRSFVGQGPEEMGAMATCSGPCTEATKPPRTDVTMFFELGVHWGR